jgi:NAD-dependent dihydropyrimidine dehydrogenase PreA subunit
MRIDKDLCIACEACIPYCLTGAIAIGEDGAGEIDLDLCVECGVCVQTGVCESEAIVMDELEWPRLIRRTYSNVLYEHPGTGMIGRGTEEMKTNEITGNFRRGEVGVGVEIGRPDIGTTFRDVDKITRVMAALGAHFPAKSPTTKLMLDPATGAIREDVLNERVICAIVESKITPDKLPEMLAALSKVAKEIDTVFSIDIVTVAENDGSVPNIEIVKKLGYPVRPNAKVTMGLGRPLFKG